MNEALSRRMGRFAADLARLADFLETKRKRM
jgi:hypothetical protein